MPSPTNGLARSDAALETITRLAGRPGNVPTLEGDRYSACAETYEAASDQRQGLLDWFVATMIDGLPRESASVLSVGCGSGAFDETLLAAIGERCERVRYVGVDPNPRQCDRFRERLCAAEDPRIEVAVHASVLEDQAFDDSFDLAHMVHCLYYMDDPHQALALALRALRDGGKLVICLAPNEILNTPADRIWQRQLGRRSWFSEDLRAELERRGLDFTEERIDASLDVTACFDPASSAGARVADFIAQVDTAQATPELRHAIMDYLDSTSKGNDTGRWLPHPVDVFVVNAQ